ncbi:MAG: beta-hydroxyacyl-ACP dehydratase [Phycisphaerae bacterium]|nr:beta-hydroxyacyl-ACP dehydratase [Phycisphaerae bacterium]|tara:strand:- start:6939 stop:7340 length:402 start_codon:yes stop_codon:yes gene_type:complete
MRFQLIDHIQDRGEAHIKAVKQVSAAEEYLGDHFPGFPILPGVMMLESLVQAARALLQDGEDHRLVLGEVKSVKYGAMVKPGERLQVEVTAIKRDDQGQWSCKGKGIVLRSEAESTSGETAISGRFTMRPIRV